MQKQDGPFHLKFGSSPRYEHHECVSFRDGDWIIHRCPKCDYELRDNWRTGELVIKNSKININHSGAYFPEVYAESFTDQN
ncbi:MAG: hypothetical protein D6743_14530 [Calditrichaeota bacterium]|nr:MAG: hypothetical protein D6743_14530 [Calditrichota bacterium]